MKRLLLLILVLISLSVAAQQKIEKLDKLTVPLVKIPNATVAPSPSTSMMYAIGNHLYWGANRLDTVGGSTDTAGWHIAPKSWVSLYFQTQALTTSQLATKANVSHSQAQSTVVALPDSLLNKYTKAQTNRLTDTTQYANVIKWGADKNGWVSSTAAFQAAINSGKPVLIPDGNYLIDSLNLLDNTTIIGMGIGHSQLILPSGGGHRVLIKINGKNYVSITGVSLVGGDYSYSWSTVIGTRIGIEIINSGYVYIEKSKITGFNAYGVKALGTNINLTFFHKITNIETSYNYCGYDIESNVEYGDYVNLSSPSCKYGVRMSGGNNKFINFSCEDSYVGFYQFYAPNNGHGSIVGSSFNHCLRYGIYVDSVQVKGMTFTACQIHNGGLLVNKSQNIRFAGGSNIMADSIKFVGSCLGSGFSDCTINVGANPFTRNPATDFTVCKNNLYSDLSTANLSNINDMWVVAGSNLVYPKNGYVGIGTTAPNYSLCVVGTSSVRFNTSNAIPEIISNNSTSASATITMPSNIFLGTSAVQLLCSSSNTGNLYAQNSLSLDYLHTDATTHNSAIYIMGYGKAKPGYVGIGTTNPNYLLDISGTMRATTHVYLPVNTGEITASVGITSGMLAGDMRYNGTSAIDITANPQIVAGVDGQEISITGLSDTYTLKFDTGTGLRLSTGNSCTLGLGDIIAFRYVASLGVWIEIYRRDNN